jgi:hypothetical protein
MDLNIGSAFWFASRGQGYLYSSTGTNSNDSGSDSTNRPLLRRSEEDTLLSVGLDEQKLQLRELRNKAKSEGKKIYCSITTTSSNSASNDNDGATNNTAVQQCSRIMKVGCIYNACKRCCDRIHTTSVLNKWKEMYIQHNCDISIIDSFDITGNPCMVHSTSTASSTKGKELNKVKTNLLRIFMRTFVQDTSSSNTNMDGDNYDDLVEDNKSPLQDTAISSAVSIHSATINTASVDERNANIIMENTSDIKIDTVDRVEMPTPEGKSDDIGTASSNENVVEGFSSNSTSITPITTSSDSCTGTTITPYMTSARVLLVGIGADEQLAGYGRHRTVFADRGEEGLVEELNTDLQRLWTRNLGRLGYAYKCISLCF